ncbi:bifunctional alpha/beta hydrolase/OsmC family protein [Rhodocaloribacter litoris]|uniref:bifunctional alpha/beta hydrolase/OsmC family protein n=1 Tax=Rhodocaloribacter litoris TaxID=2558931 RepID=UPI00142187B1|nr:bifunctional alpha/beta hydrolase/OsmC family protein [Rhodocaloribacter litoris]QXD15560.1 bifunctional alpha/beta hydrolase/OsmC family protein [Rhodocaloribacter litoris]
MNFKRITFENRNGQRLSARLDLPVDGDPLACALFAHCFTCGKNLRALRYLSEALTEAGIAVLRFDFTGLGESEGDFAETTFSSNVEDLVDAAAFLARSYAPPALLIGHSLGGAAVLQAAAQLDAVRAVATIGAPFDPEHVLHLFEDVLDEIERDGVTRVRLAGRAFTVKKAFVDDLAAQNVRRVLRDLKRPLMLLHAPMDQVVGIDNAALLFEAARHPKSFVSLDRADHLLSNEEDARYAGTVIAAWARRYLGVSQAERKHPDPADNRIVAHIDRAHYRTEILANGHALLADEPRTVGGTNAGPTPYDLLVAALGACTAMTLRMYADRKDWPLESVTVRLLHRKVHARDCDCGAGETSTGKIDLVEREVELAGDLTREQRGRLVEIANRCPVHRTLTEGQVVVKTREK